VARQVQHFVLHRHDITRSPCNLNRDKRRERHERGILRDGGRVRRFVA